MARLTRDVLRGQVWWITLPGIGEKPMLVVSNNERNRALPTVLTVRITSAAKPTLDTIVPLAAADPLRGSVLCDDIALVSKERFKRSAGALSGETMRKVNVGLGRALALE